MVSKTVVVGWKIYELFWYFVSHFSCRLVQKFLDTDYFLDTLKKFHL